MGINACIGYRRLVIALTIVAFWGACARDKPMQAIDVTAAKLIQNPNAYVGNPVQLKEIKVFSVVGDRTFWVGENDTQRLFVVLDKSLDQPARQEWSLDINKGQTVAISGEVRKVPAAEEIQDRWRGLSDSERAPLEDQQVYLHAERIDIVSQ